jgi:hypothetical protein
MDFSVSVEMSISLWGFVRNLRKDCAGLLVRFGILLRANKECGGITMGKVRGWMAEVGAEINAILLADFKIS